MLVSGLDGFNPQFFESSKFNASLRSTLPRNFDVKATPKDKMKKLEKIRGELLKDLTTMEQLHKKIMTPVVPVKRLDTAFLRPSTHFATAPNA